MEYPILLVIIFISIVTALVLVIRTLTKFLFNKKKGEFSVKLKAGRFEFSLDAHSEKT